MTSRFCFNKLSRFGSLALLGLSAIQAYPQDDDFHREAVCYLTPEITASTACTELVYWARFSDIAWLKLYSPESGERFYPALEDTTSLVAYPNIDEDKRNSYNVAVYRTASLDYVMDFSLSGMRFEDYGLSAPRVVDTGMKAKHLFMFPPDGIEVGMSLGDYYIAVVERLEAYDRTH